MFLKYHLFFTMMTLLKKPGKLSCRISHILDLSVYSSLDSVRKSIFKFLNI